MIYFLVEQKLAKYLFIAILVVSLFMTILDSLIGYRADIITLNWLRLLDDVFILLLVCILFYRTLDNNNSKYIYNFNKNYTYLANYFHLIFFGLAQRTIVFFKEPNTLALFNIISFYVIYIYIKERLLKKIIIFYILSISIILTGYTTLLLTLVLIIFIINVKVNIKFVMLFFLILLETFYSLVPYMPSCQGLINCIFSAYPINLLVSFELASLLIIDKERGINVNN